MRRGIDWVYISDLQIRGGGQFCSGFDNMTTRAPSQYKDRLSR